MDELDGFGIVGIGQKTRRGVTMPNGPAKRIYYRPNGAACLLPINMVKAKNVETGQQVVIDYYLLKGFTLEPPKGENGNTISKNTTKGKRNNRNPDGGKSEPANTDNTRRRRGRPRGTKVSGSSLSSKA